MAEYAKLAVSAANYSFDQPYTYLVPDELAEQAVAGVRVFVPFGQGNRQTEGLILSRWRGELLPRVKSVQRVLDERPVLSEQNIRLALWMRERYFCTVYDGVKAMLPAGLYYAARDSYTLNSTLSPDMLREQLKRSPAQLEIVEFLLSKGGKADREQLLSGCQCKTVSAALRTLTEAGILSIDTSISRNVGDKTERIVTLTCSAEDALSQISKTSKAQKAVIQLLSEVGSASLKDIGYFTGTSKATVNKLEEKGIVSTFLREVYRLSTGEDTELLPPPVLNQEQNDAYQGISSLIDANKPACALLYGVTGSGKTQVYIRLIHHVIEQSKTALVLVPEIALTPQLLHHFEAQFGQKVAILHSSLTAGARYDEWKRVRDGKAQVVVGTRSAIFAPLSNIGLIVLDEEQENSYQSEQNPRYHARDIAKYRCSQWGGVLVLGSATPSVASFYHAQKGRYHLFRLKKRFNEQSMPQVELVDMRKELRSGNGTKLSTPLKAALAENLERGEQAVLFLNRRGTSRMVVCGICGDTPECPNCSVKLTYHKDNGRMMCHYCGYSKELEPACPNCGGELCFVDAGVQMVQEQLKAAFPAITIARMDADSVSASHNHEDILKKFEKENISVLLGTQMVAKGLDFENVTLVGALDADQGLNVSSCYAAERTFSLLTQVVGRAGRGKRTGRAVIQTFTPQNDVIQCAARQDYDEFYRGEIGLREVMELPPIRDHYIFTVSGISERITLASAQRFRAALESWQYTPQMAEHSYALGGPKEAPVFRVMGRCRYVVDMACQDCKAIRDMLAYILKAFQKDAFNKGVRIAVDLNPTE